MHIYIFYYERSNIENEIAEMIQDCARTIA